MSVAPRASGWSQRCLPLCSRVKSCWLLRLAPGALSFDCLPYRSLFRKKTHKDTCMIARMFKIAQEGIRSSIVCTGESEQLVFSCADNRRSDFHHNWQDHGPAMRLLVEKLAQRMTNLIFHERPVGGMPIEANERVKHLFARVGQQLFRIAHIDKAARDDIGSRQRLAGFPIDGQYNHENAILSKNLTVTQHNLSDIAYPQAINEDIAAGRVAGHFEFVLRHLYNIAVFSHQNALFRHTK